MNIPSNAVPAPDAELPAAAPAAPAGIAATRPLYWSVRREVWENPSLYLAPLAVAALVLSGLLIRTVTSGHRLRALATLDPASPAKAVALPYSLIAAALLLLAFLLGVFYCLDALHGERRDRSILFWKSLPVSDVTTVLSKASIPLVFLPLLTFVVIVATQVILLLSAAVPALSAVGAAATWKDLPFFQMQAGLFYALAAIALWHAPIYAWLLLVSGWARRAPFLWAVLPPLAAGLFERITFGSMHFAIFMKDRLIGWLTQGFDFAPRGTAAVDPLSQLKPGRLLAAPGLWLGLAAAALFLGLAVRQRRDRCDREAI